MYLYIIEYIIVIIILNKLLSSRSVKHKKNESFYFTCTYFFSDASLCRSQFLNYFIFLFYVEVVLSFISCMTSLLATNFLNFFF